MFDNATYTKINIYIRLPHSLSPPSPIPHSTAAKLPPIPSYGIILLAIAAAALIVLVVVALAIVCGLKHRQHRQKKTYFFNNQGK